MSARETFVLAMPTLSMSLQMGDEVGIQWNASEVCVERPAGPDHSLNILICGHLRGIPDPTTSVRRHRQSLPSALH